MQYLEHGLLINSPAALQKLEAKSEHPSFFGAGLRSASDPSSEGFGAGGFGREGSYKNIAPAAPKMSPIIPVVLKESAHP